MAVNAQWLDGNTKVYFAPKDGVKEPYRAEFYGRQISVGQMVEVRFVEGNEKQIQFANALVEGFSIEGQSLSLKVRYYEDCEGGQKFAAWPVDEAPIASVTRIFAR